MDTVTASVAALGSSITVDITAGSAALDQAKTQLAAQANTIKDNVTALVDAVTTVPSGADADVTAAAAQLGQDKQALETSVENLRAAGEQLASATDPAGRVKALAELAASFGVAKTALQTFTSSLKTTASTGASSVKSTFASAPACAAYTTGG